MRAYLLRNLWLLNCYLFEDVSTDMIVRVAHHKRSFSSSCTKNIVRIFRLVKRIDTFFLFLFSFNPIIIRNQCLDTIILIRDSLCNVVRTAQEEPRNENWREFILRKNISLSETNYRNEYIECFFPLSYAIRYFVNVTNYVISIFDVSFSILLILGNQFVGRNKNEIKKYHPAGWNIIILPDDFHVEIYIRNGANRCTEVNHVVVVPALRYEFS